MRWNDSTSANSTGRITTTSTTMNVGDTSSNPSRESRRARVPRARRAVTGAAWRATATLRLFDLGLDLLYPGLRLGRHLGRVGASDHVDDGIRDRPLTAERSQQRSLPL